MVGDTRRPRPTKGELLPVIDTVLLLSARTDSRGECGVGGFSRGNRLGEHLVSAFLVRDISGEGH
jgi:hypothetical protein